MALECKLISGKLWLLVKISKFTYEVIMYKLLVLYVMVSKDSYI